MNILLVSIGGFFTMVWSKYVTAYASLTAEKTKPEKRAAGIMVKLQISFSFKALNK
ncbi:hypothetical protein [Pseudoalteromonas rubra]|uniref:hypothetical protein n=1 Tax=Pseudoalteromonas rubra TaxID=43658 RepID=UPI0013EE89AF|nr:hypothetical protein [Pseudoalteromonas rubra]